MTHANKRLRSILITLLILVIGITFSTSCGKADATSKKDKSKKSKSKAEPVDEESTDSVSDEEVSADEKAGSEDKKETKSNDSKELDPEITGTKNDALSVKDKQAKAELVWTDLVKGNKRFMGGKHTSVNYASVRQKLAKGQKPEAIILGCADSRVPPEFIFDRNLGELFVIRDAGNVADKVAIGSIEYAVEHLHSKVLIILGHESCGAVAATVTGEKMPSSNLTAIVDRISPAFEDSKTCLIGGESNLSCIELNVQHSAKTVSSKSSILRKAVEEGDLIIVRAVYRMETGEIVRLD